MVGRRSWAVHAALLAALLGGVSFGAQAQPVERSVARGLYNWVHTTRDAERAFAFYRDVLGIELARSPFLPATAPIEGIRPAAEARSDALVAALTNTAGARFRTVFMRAANTPFGLELAEFFDIPREDRPANSWDPGASRLIFTVRDLAAVTARATQSGAPIVTLGGRPVEAAGARALLVRDPDGYLIELRQGAPSELAAASAGEIVRTAIGVTVADRAAALEFYTGLLGLEAGAARRAGAAELALHGLASGSLEETLLTIPAVGAEVRLGVFTVPAEAAPPHAYRWRIEDVGAPQFQLEVVGLDALLARTRRAGYGFLSVDGAPIERPFGRFVFAIDPDGVLVEFVEPRAP